MISTVFHIDLDAFFASVEQTDNPSLRGKPVIVGALPGHRGVVSACSYEAREFGIKSAMPISQAARKCPQGIFLPVRMDRYLRISEKVMAIIREYSPDFRQLSIDEAWIDMTGTERLYGEPEVAAQRIKKRIRDETGLTISVGIAGNGYIAKLASEFKKPDGLYRVRNGEEDAFLNRLRLKDLWGVGKMTLSRLSELNIRTVEELRLYPKHMLTGMLGDAMGNLLYNVVRGVYPDIHAEEVKSHSISNEVTFEIDRKDIEGILNVVLELSHQVMYRLLAEKARSKTVNLKLRYYDFRTISAQQTLRHWVSSAEEIFKVAGKLFASRWDGHSAVRLVGIGLSNVEDMDGMSQNELFDDQDSKKQKAEEAVFRIKTRIKGANITKASLMKKKEK